jgi:hypothetical protein
LLSGIVKQWLPGAPKPEGDVHPFRKRIAELEVGYTLKTASRTVTLEDVEHFAHFTGDTFYAHMDDEAAKASPSSRAALPTATLSSASPRACSSSRRPVPCSPIPAWRTSDSRLHFIRATACAWNSP